MVTTLSKTTVLIFVLLWAVTAKPRRSGPVSGGTDWVEPGTVVHVPLSGDVAALYVVPVRVTRRYTGVVVPVSWTWFVPAAAVFRHCTTTPLDGVTRIA